MGAMRNDRSDGGLTGCRLAFSLEFAEFSVYGGGFEQSVRGAFRRGAATRAAVVAAALRSVETRRAGVEVLAAVALLEDRTYHSVDDVWEALRSSGGTEEWAPPLAG